MMKCHSCGNDLHIEEERCPYCGAENPYYKKHRFVMKKYRKEFDDVKEDVYKKTGLFTGLTVRITIIAILAAMNIGVLLVNRNVWNIERYRIERNNKEHYEEYAKRLDEMEAEERFYELSVFWEENSLYYGESFDAYNNIASVCNYYEQIYREILMLEKEYEFDYMTQEKRISVLCDNIDYMYGYMIQKEYSNPECFNEQHTKAMEKVKERVECMLVAYAHLTPEEAEQFWELSDGRKQLAIEKGLGLYEE